MELILSHQLCVSKENHQGPTFSGPIGILFIGDIFVTPAALQLRSSWTIMSDTFTSDLHAIKINLESNTRLPKT